jgi:hypothetical protein
MTKGIPCLKILWYLTKIVEASGLTILQYRTEEGDKHNESNFRIESQIINLKLST